MNYCLRIVGLILALWVAIAPQQASMAASSSLVTPSAFENLDLKNKDFRGKNLQKLDFAKVDLTEANFNDADLRGTVFNGSILDRASFHGANFTNGFAYLTSFKDADLSDAILAEAILSFSDFEGADVTGADFTFAVLDRRQISTLCKTASGVNSQTGVDTRESIGCR